MCRLDTDSHFEFDRQQQHQPKAPFAINLNSFRSHLLDKLVKMPEKKRVSTETTQFVLKQIRKFINKRDQIVELVLLGKFALGANLSDLYIKLIELELDGVFTVLT